MPTRFWPYSGQFGQQSQTNSYYMLHSLCVCEKDLFISLVFPHQIICHMDYGLLHNLWKWIKHVFCDSGWRLWENNPYVGVLYRITGALKIALTMDMIPGLHSTERTWQPIIWHSPTDRFFSANNNVWSFEGSWDLSWSRETRGFPAVQSSAASSGCVSWKEWLVVGWETLRCGGEIYPE